MASQPFSLFILGISISLFISQAHSLTCKSQKLPANRTYANCTDLPTLSATLHFTYNATNRSLSVAFAATPTTANGWVAWGVNPTGGGMVGTQALIAYKHDDGKLAVDTYNLTSYEKIDPVKKLSVDTWDIAAEESDGATTIFAVVKVPEKADNVSQVWQVGPVVGGRPGKHEFKPDNLGSKTALPGTTAVGSGNSTSSGGGSGSGSGNTTSGSEKSGAALVMGERFGLGFYLGLALVLVSFMSMRDSFVL